MSSPEMSSPEMSSSQVTSPDLGDSSSLLSVEERSEKLLWRDVLVASGLGLAKTKLGREVLRKGGKEASFADLAEQAGQSYLSASFTNEVPDEQQRVLASFENLKGAVEDYLAILEDEGCLREDLWAGLPE